MRLKLACAVLLFLLAAAPLPAGAIENCPGLKITPQDASGDAMPDGSQTTFTLDILWHPLGYPGEQPPSVSFVAQGTPQGASSDFDHDPLQMQGTSGVVNLLLQTYGAAPGSHPITVRGSF